jgi:hypothetical protein
VLCVLALVDVMFIGGWPPKWWPPLDRWNKKLE